MFLPFSSFFFEEELGWDAMTLVPKRAALAATPTGWDTGGPLPHVRCCRGLQDRDPQLGVPVVHASLWPWPQARQKPTARTPELASARKPATIRRLNLKKGVELRSQ